MSNELDGFETVSTQSGGGNGTKSPIVKVTLVPGGQFRGIFVSKKLRDSGQKNDKGEPKMDYIANFKIIETNMQVVTDSGKKDDEGRKVYVPVNAPAGTEVCIFGAPTRLARALDQIETGSKYEVLFVYEGKKAQTINGRRISAHNFKVGKKLAAVAAATSEEGLPD